MIMKNPSLLSFKEQPLKARRVLDLDSQESSEAINQGGYVHRAIATNRDELSDSEIIHWYKVNWCVALREGALGYNQRAEDSENRIKELKLDFGGDTLPCPDFNANALYFFNLCTVLEFVCPYAPIAAGRVGAPSSNDPALAFVGHRGKSRQNGAATICKTAGKTPNIVGTRCYLH